MIKVPADKNSKSKSLDKVLEIDIKVTNAQMIAWNKMMIVKDAIVVVVLQDLVHKITTVERDVNTEVNREDEDIADLKVKGPEEVKEDLKIEMNLVKMTAKHSPRSIFPKFLASASQSI